SSCSPRSRRPCRAAPPPRTRWTRRRLKSTSSSLSNEAGALRVAPGRSSARSPAERRAPFGWAAPWLLLAPALIPLVVLVLVPYVGALLYSLTDARLTNLTQPALVGANNFGAVVSSRQPPFWLVVEATLVFTLGTVLGSLGLGTGL